jgi:signal transduction histidine kinase
MVGPAAPPQSPEPDAARLAAVLAGCLVALVGASVLVGWYFEIDRLKGVYGAITMKPNAAVGLLLAGIALCAHTARLRRFGIVCAAAAAVLGVATLSQHLIGWDLGIDQLLFTEPPGAAATASPNRMGPNAATSLMLAGCALLLLFSGTPTAIRHAQWMAVTGVLLALLAISGYFYGAEQLYAVARFTGIALHTAVALAVLSAGILAARADAHPMALFLSDGPGGTLLRRLVAPVIVIPLGMGYLVVKGREADVFDRASSIALFAVSVIVLLGTTVWLTAKAMEAADRRRYRAEQDRDLLLVRERRARTEAESASRLKDQFIAVLSHELRTPLNVMLGWTKVLESGSAPERHPHAAAVVARNGRLLARLVEDLLDISRVSAGQFEIAARPVAFNAVITASLDALAPAAESKGVRLVPALDPRVGVIEGDAERLQQIVGNLLSNAVKFTAAGGVVDIRSARQGAVVTLTVSDSGIGFDETFAAQLFQPFRQADSTAKREHGGLGLGLSIARHIAEKHGGSLAGCSAGPGRGATFTLSLPAGEPHVASTAVADCDRDEPQNQQDAAFHPVAAGAHHESAHAAVNQGDTRGELQDEPARTRSDQAAGSQR